MFSVAALVSTGWMFAQETDSAKTKNIEEIVITGQFSPQSVSKSLFKVEVIDQQQIKNMAATNVAEVLNQNLNIMIVPDRSSGNSQANILGLGGEYIKVLIDNIPIVSDESLGNSFDLTKINLNNVERIEIVKGSMGVDYGNNAVTGVINIITKKTDSKKFNISAALQEETVGKEYDWYRKGEGRHVQSLNLGYNINENWYVAADLNHNDFQGFKGKSYGYKYFSENNDLLRGYEWQPKDQLNENALIKFHKNKTTVFYKVGHLKEEINYRDPKVSVENLDGGNRTFVSNDRDYFTRRWLHQLNISTVLGHINYTGDFSYQTQKRKYEDYIYDVPARKERSREPSFTYFDTEVIYSRGMFSNFLNSKKINFQLGYELDQTNGYSSYLTFFNNNGKDIRQNILTYAHFISAEWQVSEKFWLRPGFRLTLSDRFKELYNASLTAKMNLSPNSDVRFIGGSANRFPSYEELYTYQVDANHDIRGNENLNPETGFSTGVFYDFKNREAANPITFNLSGMFLQVEDRIELAVINFRPLQYRYVNINKYRSLLFSGSAQYKINNLTLNSAVSLLGISRTLYGARREKSPDNFYFSPEANFSADYKLNKTNTLFSLFYKYSGSSKQVILLTDLNENSYFETGKIGDFSMMNFTISQPFFNDHLELAAGVKNIFDVTTVENSVRTDFGHSGSAGFASDFYGRSFFARVGFKF